MVAWQEFLTSNPEVCAGEICAAGTRIPVTVMVHGHAGVVLFRPDSAGRRAVLSFVRARLSELLEIPLAGGERGSRAVVPAAG